MTFVSIKAFCSILWKMRNTHFLRNFFVLMEFISEQNEKPRLYIYKN